MQGRRGARRSVERRWEKRRTALIQAHFREHGRTRSPVEVVDLSRLGCRVRLTNPIILGKHAWVTLPSLQAWNCSVAWLEGHDAGLEFSEPLHPAVADLVVERAQPALPDWL